jgi:hypothetical protein
LLSQAADLLGILLFQRVTGRTEAQGEDLLIPAGTEKVSLAWVVRDASERYLVAETEKSGKEHTQTVPSLIPISCSCRTVLDLATVESGQSL